jgi:hypothetical protein
MRECKKIKDLMVNALINKSECSETEHRELQAHLKVCARCSEEYKKLAGLMTVMDKRQQPQMSEAFWDNYYSRLEEELDALEEQEIPAVKASGRRRWLGGFDLKVRWLLYPAAAVVILVVGFAIGQYLSLTPGNNIVDTAISSMRQLSPAVAQHFDNMRPLLLDYSNYSPQETRAAPEETVMVEKSTVQKLLLENQLLKRMVAKEKNITVKQLMDELELILIEVSNSEASDEETRRAVQKLIKENDILFKMKVLNKKEPKPLTI